MAFTSEQEQGIKDMLTAFQNGKRINDLPEATGALKDMSVEVMDETGETRRMELAKAIEQQATTAAWTLCASCPKNWGWGVIW